MGSSELSSCAPETVTISCGSGVVRLRKYLFNPRGCRSCVEQSILRDRQKMSAGVSEHFSSTSRKNKRKNVNSSVGSSSYFVIFLLLVLHLRSHPCRLLSSSPRPDETQGEGETPEPDRSRSPMSLQVRRLHSSLGSLSAEAKFAECKLAAQFEYVDAPPVYATGLTATVLLGRRSCLTHEPVAIKVVDKVRRAVFGAAIVVFKQERISCRVGTSCAFCVVSNHNHIATWVH